MIKSLKRIFEEEETHLDKFVKDLKDLGVKFSSGEAFDIVVSELSIFLNAILTPAIKELNHNELLAKLVYSSSGVEFPITVEELQDRTGLTDGEVISSVNARFFSSYEDDNQTLVLFNESIKILVDYLNVMGMEEEEQVGP